MDEDEMTFDELRASMLSGAETSVNPGPRPVLADEPGEPATSSVRLSITGANFDVTYGSERHGASRTGRPVRLAVGAKRPLLHSR
jgi:hypothetical protein